MKLGATALAILVSSAVALGNQSADRSQLNGTWQEENAKGKDARTLVLEEKEDGIRITESQGAREVADFECNTMGQACNVKEAGKTVQVSLWFNGPKLVELETRGSEVVKRRFAVNGDVLEMETIPMVPAGKPEATRFQRVKVEGARQ